MGLLPGPPVGSYPTFPPLPQKSGGLFLLHLSGGRPRPMLSVILLCEARTFLTGSPLRGCPARCRFIISVVGGIVKEGLGCPLRESAVIPSTVEGSHGKLALRSFGAAALCSG